MSLWVPGDKINAELTLKIETLTFEIAQLEFKIKALHDTNKETSNRIDELKMAIEYAQKEAAVVGMNEVVALKGNIQFYEAMLRRNGEILIQYNREYYQSLSDLEDYKAIAKCEVVNLELYKNSKKKNQ